VNPSTACATVLVDELARCGVREVVLCPGSRSAPLAYAVQAAERAGRLRLHVRIDERSAGFLALGLAKASGAPVAVMTTSGTAVANLHPAVLEAHHAGVPLVVVSADRPAELRGTGANQTTVQPGMFGAAVAWSADLPAPEHRAGQNGWWRSTIDRAVAAATGAAGPVHLNVAFRDPLVAEDEAGWPEPLEGRAGGRPWVQVDGGAGRGAGHAIAHVERTLVVLGDTGSAERARTAARWATDRGYPLLAEPFGALDARVEALPHGPLLLEAEGWLAAHVPERVVVIGRVTLARPVAALLRRPGMHVEVVSTVAAWPDPSHVAAIVHPWSAIQDGHPTDRAADRPADHRDGGDGAATPAGAALTGGVGSAWSHAWHDAGAALAAAVAAEGLTWPSGLAVAATVASALPDDALLVLGSSNPVRDLDLGLGVMSATGARDVEVLANRGLAGIDGVVSTAVGAALARPERAAYALLGDLTVVHDTNGLTIGPGEPRPDLTLVVVNDDGGGIFATLEYGAPERAVESERVFGTPTGTDLAALCAAHGVAHTTVTTTAALVAAVAARPRGMRVVEVRVDRAGHREAHARLRRVAFATLDVG